MKIEDLTIKEIRELATELIWTPEEEKNGNLWLKRARAIRDRTGLTDKNILDIANNRLKGILA